MPLIKSSSKQAFKKNLETEMKAGKPKDQSLAIAYNTQKHNMKKMSKGGLAKDASPSQNYDMPVDSEERIMSGHAAGKCPACGHDGDAMLHRGGMALTERELKHPIVPAPERLADGGQIGEDMLKRSKPMMNSGSPTMDRAALSSSGEDSLTERIMKRRGLEQQELAMGGEVKQLQAGDDSDDAFEDRVEYSTHLDDQDKSMPTEEHDADHTDDDNYVGLIGQILKKRRSR